MSNLIERLEQASGPDKELDEEILRLLGWRGSPLPAFSPTGSIDFVMAEIVPEEFNGFSMSGQEWAVPRFEKYPFSVEFYRKGHESLPGGGDYGKDWVRGAGKTFALAACIAALMAREVTGTQS